MIAINELGFELFEEILDFEDDLQVNTVELDCGALVVDAGVKAKGGFGAGVYLSRICMADLADIQLTQCQIGDVTFPGIQVATDHPAVSCMASQCAMWQIKVGKYFAMGSGPARALARKTKELYEKIGFEEFSDVGAIVLEANKLPNDEVAIHIAEACGIEPEDLRIAVAKTDSIAGMTQVSARVVETGLHKLYTMGFDINTIHSGWGRAPIAPIAGDSTRCMGCSNDAIIYGGETYYSIDYPNIDELISFIKNMPSLASKDYGAPFYDTFKAAGFDFFKVDHNVFAPASVIVNELACRRTLSCGKLNPSVLLDSFGLESI